MSHPLGLRTHALLISCCLLLLTGLLGGRAYQVASQQAALSERLARGDLETELALSRIDRLAAAAETARRKHAITRDALYLELQTQALQKLQSERESLRILLLPMDPSLAAVALELGSAAQIGELRAALARSREGLLREGRHAARGLKQLMALALGLSAAVTGWVLFLFFRGLIAPLRRLRGGLARIRNGELEYRIPEDKGVAELRALARSFNHTSSRLQELERAKTDFLAAISHEIKNPLAALKEGLAFLSEHGDRLTPQARSRGFSACLISSKRLELMINNLLKLSRGEQSLFPSEFSVQDVPETIQAAIDEVQIMAAKKGMRFRFNSSDSSSADGLSAAFNRDALMQAFNNLLMNAIKYGDENTVIDVEAKPVLRTLRAGPRDAAPVPHVEISVVNTGREIPASETARVFEPFYRASNTGRQTGMGIGLNVVKRIMDAHFGDVAASSGQGRTKLSLWIPGKSAGAPLTSTPNHVLTPAMGRSSS